MGAGGSAMEASNCEKSPEKCYSLAFAPVRQSFCPPPASMKPHQMHSVSSSNVGLKKQVFRNADLRLAGAEAVSPAALSAAPSKRGPVIVLP